MRCTLRSRLEKQLTDLRRRHHYMRDAAPAPPSWLLLRTLCQIADGYLGIVMEADDEVVTASSGGEGDKVMFACRSAAGKPAHFSPAWRVRSVVMSARRTKCERDWPSLFPAGGGRDLFGVAA